MTPEDLFSLAASEGIANAVWRLRDESATAMNAGRLASWEARYQPLRLADEVRVIRSADVIDLPSFAIWRARIRTGHGEARRLLEAKGTRLHPKIVAAWKAGKS